MILLHNIGERKHGNYTSREKLLTCKDRNDSLSFDGVYRNVWENRDILKGFDVTLFIIGDYVGKDNSFDHKMPLERFCDWNEIMDLVINYNCKLGWHSWSHRNLSTLPYDEIVKEVTPPFIIKAFAYPYGWWNEKVLKAVKEASYEEAYTIEAGDNTPLLKKRYMVWW